MISFKNHTVTVHRPAWITERGALVPGWDNATTHEIAGCRVQPRAGDVVIDSGSDSIRRDGVVSSWWLDLPMGSDIQPTDRISHPVIGPDPARIDGPIQIVPSPTGLLNHLECKLVRADG